VAKEARCRCGAEIHSRGSLSGGGPEATRSGEELGRGVAGGLQRHTGSHNVGEAEGRGAAGCDRAGRWPGGSESGGGGSGATTGGWVCERRVKKVRCFWQKHSPNCDFLYFTDLPPYPPPKIYDGWVQREG
jgi:hypothetical protein